MFSAGDGPPIKIPNSTRRSTVLSSQFLYPPFDTNYIMGRRCERGVIVCERLAVCTLMMHNSIEAASLIYRSIGKYRRASTNENPPYSSVDPCVNEVMAHLHKRVSLWKRVYSTETL